MEDPIISVIIVNFNGLRFLEGNLSSVFGQSYKAFEVILVDNGSADGSVEFVKEKFPAVRLVLNKNNEGFARANNQGIEASRGEFVLTLNNDTVLERDFLEMLAGRARACDERTGMWAPKILSLKDRAVIDSVGGLLIYKDGLAKGRGRLERDTGQYDRGREAFIPSACAALYRRKMLEEIGLFDYDFFAYCEDTDLGLRARLSGWKAQSVPEAKVYHHYSGTGGKYTALKAYLVERNRLWVALKNLPAPMVAASFFYTFWRFLVQAYGIATGKGAGSRFIEGSSSFGLVKILFKSYYDALKGLPKTLKKRKAVQGKRKASSEEIRRWFRDWGMSAGELVLKD